MKNKIGFLLLFLTGFLSHTFAQGILDEGYIITMDNDTIHGTLTLRSDSENSKSGLFKYEGKEKEYTPSQIKGYGSEKGYFYSSQILENFFVEVLVKGELNLYKYGKVFIVQKEGGRLVYLGAENPYHYEPGQALDLKSDQWETHLMKLVSDCSINQLTREYKYTERYLTDFVQDYNQCKGVSFTTYKDDLPWVKFEYGLKAGVKHSTLNVLTPEKKEYMKYMNTSMYSVDPSYGVMMNISFPRTSGRLYFQGELEVSKSSFSTVIEEYKELRGANDYHTIKLDYVRLYVPLSMKYFIWEGKMDLALQAGLVYSYPLRSKENSLVSEKLDYDMTTFTTEGRFVKLNNFSGTPWVGVEILKPFKKFKLGTSLRYSHSARVGEDYDGRNTYVANVNQYTFSVVIYK